MLPSLAQRLALVMLFVWTDPSVLPATLVFRTLSEVSTLVFFALSIVMYTVRTIPQRGAPGFYPRFVAVVSTFSSLGFLLLPAARTVVLALPGLASLAARRRHFRDLRADFSRTFDQPAAGGPATGNPRAVCPRPPSTLSWRDGRNRRDCAAAPVSMDAVVAGTGMGIAISAHEIRGTGAIPKFSGIRRLHGADGPFGAGRVLVADLAGLRGPNRESLTNSSLALFGKIRARNGCSQPLARVPDLRQQRKGRSECSSSTSTARRTRTRSRCFWKKPACLANSSRSTPARANSSNRNS